MAIPDLTSFGLLPEGIHECTLAEASAFLCLNEHRSNIWARFENFLTWTATLPPPDAILIDGSYVTDKAVPSDVDVVIDISSCTPDAQSRWFDAWATNHKRAKADYDVDFYPFVIGTGNDFSAFFQYVRVDEALRRGIPPTARKGILKVQQ